jgi:hypothetical protein
VAEPFDDGAWWVEIAPQGHPSQPVIYTLGRLRVEHLPGLTHVDLMRIAFEVKETPEVLGRRLT